MWQLEVLTNGVIQYRNLTTGEVLTSLPPGQQLLDPCVVSDPLGSCKTVCPAGTGNTLECTTPFAQIDQTFFDDTVNYTVLDAGILDFSADAGDVANWQAFIDTCTAAAGPGDFLIFSFLTQDLGFSNDRWISFTLNMWNPAGIVDFNVAPDTTSCDLSALEALAPLFFSPENTFAGMTAVYPTPGPGGFHYFEARCFTAQATLGGGTGGGEDALRVLVCNPTPAAGGIDLSTLEACCSANNALLATIDADTGAISTNSATTVTSLASIDTSLTSINTQLSAACPGINVTICNTSLTVDTGLSLTTLETCCAANTALLTTIDADTSAISTNTASAVTELVAVNAELDSQTALLTTISNALGGACPGLNVTICNTSLTVDTGLSLTTLETCCAANTALLTTIDADTSVISINTAGTITALTAVNAELDAQTLLLTSIDNALGGACPGMNVTICNASLAVTTDLNLTTLETCCAANTALLTTIDADTSSIATDTAAMAVDLAAIEVLLTTANTCCAANTALLTTIDADTSAMATDLAAIETLLTTANACCAANTALLTTIDADTGSLATDLNAILTDTNAMVVDLAALEVCCNAGNALLTTIDADTSAIATDTAAMVVDLAAIEVVNTDIQTVLRAACGSGNEQNVNVCSLPAGVQRTPARLVTTIDGTVAAGTLCTTIHNHSNNTTATVLGADLPAGETVTFCVDAPDTLAAIAYVTNGAELHISTIT